MIALIEKIFEEHPELKKNLHILETNMDMLSGYKELLNDVEFYLDSN